MPYVKVKVHFVWSTKEREPFLATKEIRKIVWQHIKENGKSKGIYIDVGNGYKDHCHCLISVGIDQTISKIMQLIKGESSFWINKQSFFNNKFEWHDEYFAVSVSESMMDRVRNYILNQEEHYKMKTYQEEYAELMLKYGFEKFG
ncbi:IS200/IS605 family transposase [soil metagenome]